MILNDANDFAQTSADGNDKCYKCFEPFFIWQLLDIRELNLLVH